MDNPQHYQPLSAAITPSSFIVQTGRSPHQHQQYAAYPSHAPHQQPISASSAQNHRQEEEEEEEDDVEGELDPTPHESPSAQSSPRAATTQSAKYSGSASTATQYVHHTQDQNNAQQTADDNAEKRKPGRPRGSRNRKPKGPTSTPTAAPKAPTNTQHPGFYSYPPAPGGQQAAQNHQFYEFQWRALNLCSEFYNAAEELIKNAPPMVIAQCYQMGPVQKIDPLALIAEAKRVCDNLLANPAQLVGTIPQPVYPTVPQYAQMPPPPPPPQPTSAPSGSGSAPPQVITNPQSFVMSLSTPGMPPGPHPGTYYPPPVYATPGQRYPGTVTTPYYSYPQAAATYYAPPPQPQPAPVPTTAPSGSTTPVPPPSVTHVPPQTTPATSTSGTISTFNAATGTVAAGGQQGSWSEEETERLRRLAEQSREANKGEIEWDWVVQQWGNSRTRHQILLKATSMGLKESTTRGTKRRRDAEHQTSDSQAATAASSGASAAHGAVSSASVTPSMAPAVAPPPHSPAINHTTPTQSNATINNSAGSSSVSGSRAQTNSTTSAAHQWPAPTIAANIPSPVMVHNQPDPQQQQRTASGTTTYYRRPSGATQQQQQQQGYGTAATATTTSPTTTHSRPPSSQASQPQHQFMYRPNEQGGARRENGYS
ncbi:unnamed protein product [Somion occarium]|uniref:Myb-like domain-containing protein n=1 Tax=Somion occarium TaxID=3059160 RepID=A0ABP1E8R9_9APHY